MFLTEFSTLAVSVKTCADSMLSGDALSVVTVGMLAPRVEELRSVRGSSDSTAALSLSRRIFRAGLPLGREKYHMVPLCEPQ